MTIFDKNFDIMKKELSGSQYTYNDYPADDSLDLNNEVQYEEGIVCC